MKWAIQPDEPGDATVLSWCEDVDSGAMVQLHNLRVHPIVKFITVMPDCHQGYGMPIGGVIACEGGVIPNAVGVDIGCGMCAVRTDYLSEAITQDEVKQIIRSVSRDVPVGFRRRKDPIDWDGFGVFGLAPEISEELDSARYQLGTLGGGNHFIELQAGSDGYVWLMLHSGSRNIGYKIASLYHKAAVKLCERWHVDAPKDLAFLPSGEMQLAKYLSAMEFALRFAMENRRVMMQFFMDSTEHTLGCGFDQVINIHHNFVAVEYHKSLGNSYWIHRKGATQAREGQPGIIPGSMGTSSYIVVGKGNKESLMSCSHGAGRRMGRAEFNRTTTIEDADASIKNVVFSGWSKNRKGKVDLSEAPAAYKDIDVVMAAQEDLVEIVTKLTPLGVLKG